MRVVGVHRVGDLFQRRETGRQMLGHERADPSHTGHLDVRRDVDQHEGAPTRRGRGRAKSREG